MAGIDARSGRRIERREHISQSIATILATPLGSRVMRREFGSKVPMLIDRPMNTEAIMEVYAAAADALERWEPRVELNSIAIEEAGPSGVLTLIVDCTDRESGETIEVRA